jgi:transmembrane sensor
MSDVPQDDQSEAATWMRAIAFVPNPGPELFKDFGDWLERDEERGAEFLSKLASTPNPRKILTGMGSTLVSVSRQLSSGTPDFQPRGLLGRWQQWIGVATSAAAIVMVAMIWLLTNVNIGGWQTYQTGIGELRRVVLDDGSTLQMNTRSSASVRFRGGKRQIVLHAGEAHFQVAHDLMRPFTVQAGQHVITAVGTAFTVRHYEGQKIGVGVTEGAVSIRESSAASGKAAEKRVSAGERGTIVPGHVIVEPMTEAQMESQTSWQKDMLVFDVASVAEIAAEMNRFNSQRIEVMDPLVAGRQMGGNFNMRDIERFLRKVEEGVPELEVRRSVSPEGNEIILLYRKAGMRPDTREAVKPRR